MTAVNHLENTLRRSVFFAVSSVAILSAAATSNAELLAGWTIDRVITSTTGSSYSYGAANLGSQTSGSMLGGSHSQSGTAWSTPVGNGSTSSLSSDKWSQGDYYFIEFSTVGYSDITVSWDQTRSSTGPSDFAIHMAVGTNSASATGYTYNVVQAGGFGSGTNSWSSTTQQAEFNRTVSLVTLYGAGVNNAASVKVFFKATGLNLGAGTNRIDNIMVNGTAIAVPSPGAAALIGLAGLASRRRRA